MSVYPLQRWTPMKHALWEPWTTRSNWVNFMAVAPARVGVEHLSPTNHIYSKTSMQAEPHFKNQRWNVKMPKISGSTNSRLVQSSSGLYRLVQISAMSAQISAVSIWISADWWQVQLQADPESNILDPGCSMQDLLTIFRVLSWTRKHV